MHSTLELDKFVYLRSKHQLVRPKRACLASKTTMFEIVDFTILVAKYKYNVEVLWHYSLRNKISSLRRKSQNKENWLGP